MPKEWDKCVARFRSDLECEISATPTGERRELLTVVNIELMRVQDMDKKNKAARESEPVGGN